MTMLKRPSRLLHAWRSLSVRFWLQIYLSSCLSIGGFRPLFQACRHNSFLYPPIRAAERPFCGRQRSGSTCAVPYRDKYSAKTTAKTKIPDFRQI